MGSQPPVQRISQAALRLWPVRSSCRQPLMRSVSLGESRQARRCTAPRSLGGKLSRKPRLRCQKLVHKKPRVKQCLWRKLPSSPQGRMRQLGQGLTASMTALTSSMTVLWLALQSNLNRQPIASLRGAAAQALMAFTRHVLTEFPALQLQYILHLQKTFGLTCIGLVPSASAARTTSRPEMRHMQAKDFRVGSISAG